MARRGVLIVGGVVVVLAAGIGGVVLVSSPGATGSGESKRGEGEPGAGGVGAADPVDVAAVLESARVYMKNRETAKAQAVLRSAVSQHPGEHRLREALADVLLQADDREGAFEQYAWVVENGSESAEAAFAAGSLAAVLGETGRAAAYHARAASLDPANADYPVHLARAQIELGRIEEAKVNLARAAVLDEGRGVVWGMLGELALRENKLEMAAQHVAKARRLEPGVVAWRVLEARVLKRRGEPERALLLLQGLAGDDRHQGPVLKTMGECLGMLGRPSDALALYEVAIEHKPGAGGFRLEAALWAERLGRTDRALELARQARMMGEEKADAVIERLGG